MKLKPVNDKIVVKPNKKNEEVNDRIGYNFTRYSRSRKIT